MKFKLLALAIIASSSLSATAATFHTPDKEFLEQAAMFNITPANWDSGTNAKLNMKNAYKFTHNVEMEKGSWSHNIGKAKGFDLDSVSATDLDGQYPMSVMLRDRLNIESLVMLKDGQLVDEYYWSGMHKDRTHLMMSVTKSFTLLTLQTLVKEGKVDLNAKISDYLPELKQSPGFRDATVQEVADMRSGIKIEFTPGKIWDERMSHVQEWNGENKYPELKSILDFGKTLKQRDDVKTGQAFDYQCMNTEMLGMLIARVTGKTAIEAMEERLWQRVGFENNARVQSNSQGEGVMSGGLNATTRDVAIMMDVLVNDGKNRKGEQILPKDFVKNLYQGNEEVKSAWKYDGFSALLPTAWYKDQIRVLNVDGVKYFLFVGIHGQIIAGNADTGVVIALTGAQDQMQGVRNVASMMMDVLPTLFKAVAKS